MVIELQMRYKQKGKHISQKEATRKIAAAFKKSKMNIDDDGDNFIWT